MKKHLHKQVILGLILLGAALFSAPQMVLAAHSGNFFAEFEKDFDRIEEMAHEDGSTIKNETSASANTGSTAESGETVEGESRAEVHTETTVNGEVVESVHKVATSTSGNANASVSHETRVNTTGDGTQKTETHTETEVNTGATGTTKTTHENTHADTENASTTSEAAGRMEFANTSSIFDTQFARFKNMISNIFDHVFSFFN